jgi:ferredoxin-NADP reductase/MOSC domain-containing protein YiiM/ferredoxin
MATLVSVNVGKPQDVSWNGRTVHTGIWKTPVRGAVTVRRLNIDGDGQGDLAGHGGEQRAVLVYQLDSYRHWRELLGRADLEHGVFGENLTVDGLPDDEVCIGDRYRIGEAELEVTQPRVTCFRVGMRLEEPRLPSLLVAHHRPGFYMRVITEGPVQAGDQVVRTRRGPHALSVADVDALLYLPGRDADQLRAALDIPALSPGWQGSFRDLLAETGTAGTGAAGGWPGFKSLTVTDVVPESASIASIYLAHGSGEPLPHPAAGQYLAFRVPGAGTPAPVRSYSLSGDGAEARYRVSVKREPHGLVSRYLLEHLRPGAQVEVAAPRGDFVLDAGGNPVLLLSAGIGLTPVLAMLHRLAAQRTAREVWWVHTTHDASTHAYAAEAADLVASLPNARSLVFYTSPAGPPGPGIASGRLTGGTVEQLGVPPDASAYVCGPETFMDDITAALTVAGLDPARIRVERFGSRAPLNPGVVAENHPPPHQPPGPPGSGPDVTFARSALTAPWSDAFGSLLELAEACDVPTQWSCRTGVCHTCVTGVLSGDATYTSPPLEPPGPGELLICSARPTDGLVLDL